MSRDGSREARCCDAALDFQRLPALHALLGSTIPQPSEPNRPLLADILSACLRSNIPHYRTAPAPSLRKATSREPRSRVSSLPLTRRLPGSRQPGPTLVNLPLAYLQDAIGSRQPGPALPTPQHPPHPTPAASPASPAAVAAAGAAVAVSLVASPASGPSSSSLSACSLALCRTRTRTHETALETTRIRLLPAAAVTRQHKPCLSTATPPHPRRRHADADPRPGELPMTPWPCGAKCKSMAASTMDRDTCSALRARLLRPWTVRLNTRTRGTAACRCPASPRHPVPARRGPSPTRTSPTHRRLGHRRLGYRRVGSNVIPLPAPEPQPARCGAVARGSRRVASPRRSRRRRPPKAPKNRRARNPAAPCRF